MYTNQGIIAQRKERVGFEEGETNFISRGLEADWFASIILQDDAMLVWCMGFCSQEPCHNDELFTKHCCLLLAYGRQRIQQGIRLLTEVMLAASSLTVAEYVRLAKYGAYRLTLPTLTLTVAVLDRPPPSVAVTVKAYDCCLE